MDSTYKLIELIGTSSTSYEEAIKRAVDDAKKTIHDLKWFEVVELRGHIEEEGVTQFQAKLKVAFKILRE